MSPDSVATVSIPNFRDVGGYARADGRRVRSGRLFRSVALDAASDEDLATLARLGVTTVFDLRRPEEQARRPDRLPEGAQLVSLDVFADGEEAARADIGAVIAHLREPERVETTLTVEDMDRFQAESYYDLVMLGSAREAYRRFFSMLAANDGASLVHCTGGKDRTGWAVAALLELLGVPREEIYADYLISDEAIRQFFAGAIDDFAARGGQRAVIERMFGARRAYLASAFATVSSEFGSIDRYFEDGLDLDAETATRLRATYLE